MGRARAVPTADPPSDQMTHVDVYALVTGVDEPLSDVLVAFESVAAAHRHARESGAQRYIVGRISFHVPGGTVPGGTEPGGTEPDPDSRRR
jgi:hypothetical protein